MTVPMPGLEVTIGGWPIVGHERAVAVLRRSIKRGQVGHAYLFVGPPGTGKRSLATTFAMAINCESVPPDGESAGEPCGLCLACSRIRRGAHPDVVYIDLETQAAAQAQGGARKAAPAKELKIETIREMQAGLTLLPYSARRKIYIIGDAERMNDEAANCLLKSLEEPPAHSILVLLAADERAVLPTISSRCLYIPLRSVPRERIAAHLRDTYGAPHEKSVLLAALSSGRVGTAIGLLNNDGAMDARSDALRELSVLSGATVTDRLDASARLAKMFTDARPDLYRLLDTWEGWWRDLLVTSAQAGDLSQNVDQDAALRSRAVRLDPQRSLAAISLIQRTRQQLQENVNPRLALEALTLGLP